MFGINRYDSVQSSACGASPKFVAWEHDLVLPTSASVSHDVDIPRGIRSTPYERVVTAVYFGTCPSSSNSSDAVRRNAILTLLFMDRGTFGGTSACKKKNEGNRYRITSFHASEMKFPLSIIKKRHLLKKERLAENGFDSQFWTIIMVASPQLTC